MPPTALLYDPDKKTWLQFDTPVQTFTTVSLSEVPELLTEIEQLVEQQSLYAVGFISYEAAAAFEPTAETLPAGDFPLLWFGLFTEPKRVDPPAAECDPPTLNWEPALDASTFGRTIDRIKSAIAGGETYQVNFTFPLATPYKDEPWPLFCRLVQNQPNSFGAWIDTGRYAVCSASPELFFERNANRLISKPMKGTTKRGTTLADDGERAEALQSSAKERAENVMVLDMIRNDLGRLPGGPVVVEKVCAVEKHPTVWQMTSTAATSTDATLTEIFTTLFPCASITGAPKLRTMHHISRLETAPRNLYTGAIGLIAPNRQARFSVAIRTALIDREAQIATYGVGAGITWDSEATSEYQECLTKAKILNKTRPPFSLLETLLWDPETGFFLLDEHLGRLQSSAEYFDYPFDPDAILAGLKDLTKGLPSLPHKVRLLLDPFGQLSIEASVITPSSSGNPLRIRLANAPVASDNLFLYHKTTHRSDYETAREHCSDCDEVLLYNEKGELTEACNYNLVVMLNGELVTPPVDSGLLAGTMRANLLTSGEIREQTLLLNDLPNCEEIYLINSVRRWRKATLVTD